MLNFGIGRNNSSFEMLVPQSYGRIRDQGKVLQTFVQSVITGSPSFMAGLYPGDTIVEVNGVDVKYAPVESVVGAIQEGSKDGRYVCVRVCMCVLLPYSPLFSRSSIFVFFANLGNHEIYAPQNFSKNCYKLLLVALGGLCQAPLAFCLRKSHHNRENYFVKFFSML